MKRGRSIRDTVGGGFTVEQPTTHKTDNDNRNEIDCMADTTPEMFNVK